MSITHCRVLAPRNQPSKFIAYSLMIGAKQFLVFYNINDATFKGFNADGGKFTSADKRKAAWFKTLQEFFKC